MLLIQTSKALSVTQERPFRIIQITDPHLLADQKGVFAGLTTQNTFEQVLKKIKETYFPCDLIIATGDIVHNDAAEQTYKRFADAVSKLGIKTIVTPGNHDDAEILKKTLRNGLVTADKHYTAGKWQFFLLDSSVKNAVNGHLKEQELTELEELLKKTPEYHTLIAMHHHPVSVGCRWLDMSGIDNGSRLMDMVEKYPNVKIIMWGHVHQDFVSEKNKVNLVATPSTCIQFKPKQVDFCLDRLPPGFRWLDLYNNGHAETGIVRLDELPTEIDFSTSGY